MALLYLPPLERPMSSFTAITPQDPSVRLPRLYRPRGRCYEGAKRLVDIAAAGILLMLFLPVMAGCAAWILMRDGRPIFYTQWRVGRDGWLFRIYKFRTMTQDAERHHQAQFAADGDPRIIRGCAWMRRSHMDETPQLWNILLGQMSMVGPRPERPEMVEMLRAVLPGFDFRLLASPGLTGLAQVRNGYTNDTAGARRKLAYDLKYLRRRSILMDLRLLLLTCTKLWDATAL